MKIILCCMNYRPEIISTGKYAYELCEYLSSMGHDVEVITAQPHYPGWKIFAGYRACAFTTERLNGVRVWRVPMYLNTAAQGLRRLLMPLSWAALATPILFWRAMLLRPNVIVSVQPTIAIAPSVWLVSRLSGASPVQHVQDIEIDTALAVGHVKSGSWMVRLAHVIERFIMRRYDLVITISEQMHKRLVDKGLQPERLAVVRNWVDTGLIRPLGRPSSYRNELELPSAAFVVQYSGQMGRKQALHLIVAAAELLKDDPDFVFVLAGDGPTRPMLEDAAAELPNFRLLPLQTTERLCEFLNLADCHILTQEAGVSELVLPSKLGGMLASGKRLLITADLDSELASFLGDAAEFVAPNDPQAIVSRLKEMRVRPDSTAAQRASKANELEASSLLPKFNALLAQRYHNYFSNSRSQQSTKC